MLHPGEILRSTIFIVSTAAMFVLIRLLGETFGDHIYFALPFMFVLQVIFILLYVLITKKYKGDKMLDKHLYCSPVLLFMSMFLTINAAGVFTTSKYISGPLQTVLGTSTILFAPLFDWLMVGARVNLEQIFGVLTIVGGVCLSIIGESNDGRGAPLVATIVFISALIIMPILSISQEIWFKERPKWHVLSGRKPLIELNAIWYLFFQIPWHLAFIPAYASVGMPGWNKMESNFGSGATCLFDQHGGTGDENCSYVWWIILALGISTMIQMTVSFHVSVNETGAYCMVIQGVCPFIANLVFGFRPIMGQYTEKPSLWIWISLVVATLGTALYRYGKDKEKKALRAFYGVDELRTWFQEKLLNWNIKEDRAPIVNRGIFDV